MLFARTTTISLLMIIACSVTGLNKIGNGDNNRSGTAMNENCRQTLKPTRTRRIVGGEDSTPGAWPWFAHLYHEGGGTCGATLISSRWLISAGHCVHGDKDYWVARLGTFRRDSNLLSPDQQFRVISHIFIHPRYLSLGWTLDNDISLLRMEEPVQFTDYIKPICLPLPTAEIRDERICTVVGMGKRNASQNEYSNTLRQLQLPLISKEKCKKINIFYPAYSWLDSRFCAGYFQGGRSTCFGDSGGPLMCEETDGRWTLLGVTSGGVEDSCVKAKSPKLFTEVAKFVTWIEQVVNGTHQGTSRSSQCNNGHRCLLGNCLTRSKICNGIAECREGSDERNCPNATLNIN